MRFAMRAVGPYRKHRVEEDKEKGREVGMAGKAIGPIGLLMEQLERHGASLDGDLEVRPDDGGCFNIMKTTWEQMRKCLERMGQRRRNQEAAGRRTLLSEE